MKVRELVAGALLTEGAARARQPAPRVSVLLPTFRRGDSGLLQRAIDSILEQSLRELELIIIDDASTDSTAQVIADSMARDGRITVLRHARNIGLPAISEYEGYLLARGDRIAFAFDDTEFAPDALERMLSESDAHPTGLIIGWVDLHLRANDSESDPSQPLGRGASVENLLSTNVIPNSGVLAPRAVLETVGLYDPHVSLVRLCDYDLWRRAARKVPLRFVDIRVGDEHGPATLDSLAMTYRLDQWTADDRMRQSRDELLRPEVFGEIDVFDLASFDSERSRSVVRQLVAGHRTDRPWMRASAEPQRAGDDVPRVLVLAHPIDASTQLLFEGPRDDPRLHVRIIDPTQQSLMELVDADTVIASRQLRQNADWISAAKSIGLTTYFSLDDNLPLMRDSGELSSYWDDYAADTLRHALRGIDGMLASTPELAASFRDQRLHDRVTALPISVPRSVSAWRDAVAADSRTGSDRVATIGLFIGLHRLEGFRRELLPALCLVAERRGTRVRVLVPESFALALRNDAIGEGVEIVPFPPSKDCFAALLHLRDSGVTVLVVPDSATGNASFKTLHPLLSAASIGAGILLPDSPPYTQLTGTPGVELIAVTDDASHWAQALERAVASTEEGGGAVEAAELRERFDPSVAATAILEALAPIPRPTDPRVRMQLLVAWFASQLALTRVQVDLQMRESQRMLVADDAFGALLIDLHHAARASRRAHALRRSPGPLQRFGILAHRGERVELSRPLTSNAYLAHRVRLAPGSYRSVTVLVWSSALPGDLLGIELVSPSGELLLHRIAALPRDDEPVTVTLDASGLTVVDPGEHELRIFTRTNQPAFVLEAVHRGRLGLRRPTVRPLVDWQRAIPDERVAP